jgi:cation transport ATPase
MGLGAFLAMDVMMVAILLYTGSVEAWAVPDFRWAMCAMSAPAIAILDYPFILGALADIRRKRPSLDTLIATGSLAAFGVSAFNTARGRGQVFFDTATMLPALVTFGKLIEASAKGRAATLVRSLESLLPAAATRLTPAGPQRVPCDQLQVGDRIVVRDGERFAIDGTLESGTTVVQESAFTGEWQPRHVGPGDAVFAGTVNGADGVTAVATQVGKEMLLWRILQMVQEAHANPPRWERMGQQIAAAFIPAVCLTAAVAGALWWASGGPARGAMVALSVLVVACPCAMGIAGPLVTALAIAHAAANGAIVRGGDVLERLGQIQQVFWDKTGTITTGKPTVAAIEPFAPVDMKALEIDDQEEFATETQRPQRKEEQQCVSSVPSVSPWSTSSFSQVPIADSADNLLQFLATLEATTSHCLGQAIVQAAKAKGIALGQATNVRNHPGLGISGQVTCGQVTRQVIAGSQDFVLQSLHATGAATASRLANTDNPQSPAIHNPQFPCNPQSAIDNRQSTMIYVAYDGQLAGRVTLTDNPRPDAAQATDQLAKMGIASDLLSGDSYDASQATARQVGINSVHAPCRPQEKIDLIKSAMELGSTAFPGCEPVCRVAGALANQRAPSVQSQIRMDDGANQRPALEPSGIRNAIRRFRRLMQIGKKHLRKSAKSADCLPIGNRPFDRLTAPGPAEGQSAIGNRQSAIMMVGDGVNDAPALAQADIGVAIGGGTDLARQAGNVILLSNQLSQLPWLISLSKFSRHIIRQNLYWALAYNAIAIAAAATGHLHPLLAAVAMVVSSLTVLWNALRIRQFPKR